MEKVLEHLKKKHKGLEKILKPTHVKSHLKIFINCLIENPAFDSQTKENMTLKPSAFGSKCAHAHAHAHAHAMLRLLVSPPPRYVIVKAILLLHTPPPPLSFAPHLPPPFPLRRCAFTDKFFKSVLDCGVLESILAFAQNKQSKDLKKTDGAKKQRLTGAG